MTGRPAPTPVHTDYIAILVIPANAVLPAATNASPPALCEFERPTASQYPADVDEPQVWDVWRPSRRSAWSGTQLWRRWELIQDSPSTWTLRFVGADGRVTQSDSGPVDRIAAVIRGSAITGQARRRLLEALERPDELDPDSPIVVSVN